MAQKRIEEKLEMVDQEISGIRAELHDLPTIKENMSSLAKSIERLGVQAEKQQQQPETLLKYIEGMIKEKTTMEEVLEGSSSKVDSMVDVSDWTMMGGKYEEKHTKLEGEDSAGDRSKFKKIEMPVFVGNDPDSWLFRAERYFQIHKLSESEKMTVSIISFDGAALNWYRSHY